MLIMLVALVKFPWLVTLFRLAPFLRLVRSVRLVGFGEVGYVGQVDDL